MPWNNPYLNPQFTPNYIPQQSLPVMQVVRVNGRGGAEAYAMGPNSSVLLLDEHEPIVYLKVTDGASYSTISAYNIAPVKEEIKDSSVNYSALEERVAKLEDLISTKSNLKDEAVNNEKPFRDKS